MRSSIQDFKKFEQLANLHVVVVGDRQQRIAVGEDRIERFADLTHFEGNVVAGDAEVKVPVKVEIVIEVMPHERLVGELLIQDLVEKGGDLGAVHRLVEIGRHPRKIDALAQVVIAPLLEALQENRHAFFRCRLPVVIDEAPQIVGQSILLAEIDVDHRQHRPLAFVNAGQEKRNDGVLDIVGLEIGGNGRAKTFDCGQELFRKRRLRCFARSRSRAGNGRGRCAASDQTERSRAALQDGPTFQGFPFHRLLLFRDDCRLSLRPKSVGYGTSLVKGRRVACWDQRAIAQSTLPELSE